MRGVNQMAPTASEAKGQRPRSWWWCPRAPELKKKTTRVAVMLVGGIVPRTCSRGKGGVHAGGGIASMYVRAIH